MIDARFKRRRQHGGAKIKGIALNAFKPFHGLSPADQAFLVLPGQSGGQTARAELRLFGYQHGVAMPDVCASAQL